MMAICSWCDQDMTALTTTTCTQKVEFPDGETVEPIPYTHWGGHYNPLTGQSSPKEPIPDGHTCHDCGIVRGGVHHPGCDMERCPRCGGQLIGCGCLSDEGDDA